MSHTPPKSVSLSRVPSLASSLSRVPSFEELPPAGSTDHVELDHISIASEVPSLNNTTEIQIAFAEQKQTFDAEHAGEHHSVCFNISLANDTDL